MNKYLYTTLLLLIFINTWYNSNSYIIKEENVDNIKFINCFNNDFINFHKGEINALNKYTNKTIKNYYKDVIYRETKTFDLLDRKIKEKNLRNQKTIYPSAVHPEEITILNPIKSKKLTNEEYKNYLISLPYTKELIEYIYNEKKEITKIIFNPAKTKNSSNNEIIEILFAGNKEQIFRKDLIFNYKDLIEQPMYNNLKLTNIYTLKVKPKQEYQLKFLSLKETGFFVNLTFYKNKLIKVKIIEFK